MTKFFLFLFSPFWSVERICKLVTGYSEVAPTSSFHIMSPIQLDTFTNVLTNITTLRSLLDSLWDTSLLKEVQFRILKKCQGKFACLVYQMLFIKERNPSLNTQTDCIRAKLVFKRTFNHVLSYLVFKHFLSFILWLDSDVSETSKRLLRNIQSQFFIIKKLHFRKPTCLVKKKLPTIVAQLSVAVEIWHR